MRLAGRAYVAGTELDEALSVAQRLQAKGYASSVAYWDPDGANPEDVRHAYLSAAHRLAADNANLDCYLSVKAPSVKFERAAFAQLVAECAKGEVRLHFDSLGPETADPTFALADELLRDYRHVSITLPGCWSRSVRDAAWAIDRGIVVRVVKGQWPDMKDGTVDPVEGYLKVIGALAGKAAHVAVASHNPAVVGPALRILTAEGTSCELELLYGLPVEHVLAIANDMGVRTRIYIPYGYGWLPYSLSQARRNPKIFWWILKDMMQGSHRTGIYRQ